MPDQHIAVGKFRCFPLRDGDFAYPKPALFPDRTDSEVFEELGSVALQPELTVGYSGLLIECGGRLILIDTGAGLLGPNTGGLAANLASCGFSPEQVGLVVLSHLHPDHIGGLRKADGTWTFANAEILLARPEYDFWMTEANQAKLNSMALLGLGEIERVILSWIQTNIGPLAAADRLSMIDGECEPFPGVALLPAFGHTPGHLAVLLSNGGQQLLFAGDAFLHPAQIRQPHWRTVFDVYPEQAADTRRKILDRCASERCLSFHSHFPFPCVGEVSMSAHGYSWQPQSWVSAPDQMRDSPAIASPAGVVGGR